MPALLERELSMDTDSSSRKRFLFAHWEGGGNTPPMLAVVRRLVAKRHEVRVISDPCNRDEVLEAGASFISWTRAPARENKLATTDPLRDWEAKGPPDLIRRLCEHLFVGSALARAQDVLAAMDEFPADVVVTSEMLLGVMAAAERAGIPCAALCSNIYLFPLPGVPPFGPGFLPARSFVGRLRDKLVETLARKTFGKFTGALNVAREALGLKPIDHPFDQIAKVERVLVQTSAAFDFPADRLPQNVVYVGPEIDDPAWVEPWQSPWPMDDRRPLVLVGFSTTFQDQSAAIRNVVSALGTQEVRAVVTVGPSVDLASFSAPANVHLCRSAPHNQILKQASLVITHAGHGTVIRALAAGVPLICMPMGRDQNDNAARVVARNVGLRLSPKASAKSIARVVSKVLSDNLYHESAVRLGRQIAEDARRNRVVEELEQLTHHVPRQV